jgi:precorrin-2 dehydrogenase/sirohydrochlorin ferrochelatase
MFPVLLDLTQLRVALIGNGLAALRRLELLDADAALHVTVYADDPVADLARAAGARLRLNLPDASELAAAQIVFAVDLPESKLEALAATARSLGILVNVEDRPRLSTVHSPAQLRRGDLLITVSTNGKSPALARRIIRFLGGIFGAEWQGRTATLGELRETWRRAGEPVEEVARRTDEWIDGNAWLIDAGRDAEPSS